MRLPLPLETIAYHPFGMNAIETNDIDQHRAAVYFEQVCNVCIRYVHTHSRVKYVEILSVGKILAVLMGVNFMQSFASSIARNFPPGKLFLAAHLTYGSFFINFFSKFSTSKTCRFVNQSPPPPRLPFHEIQSLMR